MTTATTTLIRSAGLLAGCLLAAAAIQASRVPASSADHAAQLQVVPGQVAELVLSSMDPIVSTARLRPGGPRGAATGAVSIWNPTDVGLDVRLRTSTSGPQLDAVRLSVRTGRRELPVQTVAALRRGSAGGFRLAAGDRTRLELKAWLPASARSDHQARAVEVKLHFVTRPSESRP